MVLIEKIKVLELRGLKNMTDSWNDVINSALIAIQRKASLQFNPSTKRGFRQLIEIGRSEFFEAINNGIVELKRGFDNFIPDITDFIPSQTRGKFRRELGWSNDRMVANKKSKALEVALERSIVASVHDDRLYNQMSLLSGIYNSSTLCKHVAVDLVLKAQDHLFLIELKAWDNKSNNPIYGLLEASAYFLTYLKMLTIDSSANDGHFEEFKKYKLILLAPQKYYVYWEMTNSFLQMICEGFQKSLCNSRLQVSVHYASMELDKEDFIEAILNVAEDQNSFSNLDREFKQRINVAFWHSMRGLLEESNER